MVSLLRLLLLLLFMLQRVDCELTEWSEWQVPCIDNIQRRSRSVVRSGKQTYWCCCSMAIVPARSHSPYLNEVVVLLLFRPVGRKAMSVGWRTAAPQQHYRGAGMPTGASFGPSFYQH